MGDLGRDDEEHHYQHDEQGGADVTEDETSEGQAGPLLAGLPDLPAGEMAADDRGNEAEPDDEPADPADKRGDSEPIGRGRGRIGRISC